MILRVFSPIKDRVVESDSVFPANTSDCKDAFLTFQRNIVNIINKCSCDHNDENYNLKSHLSLCKSFAMKQSKNTFKYNCSSSVKNFLPMPIKCNNCNALSGSYNYHNTNEIVIMSLVDLRTLLPDK